MYSRIIIPIDLEHKAALAKAVSTAVDLAGHYGAELVFAGIASREPGHLTDNQEAFDGLLQEFADSHTTGRALRVSTHSIMSIDLAAEVTSALLQAVEETGADLVVMATHVPGVLEHIFASHGGYVASHAKVSVMLVR